MENDIEGLVGAGHYGRSGDGAIWRKRYCDRTLTAASGRCSAHPKLRLRWQDGLSSIRKAAGSKLCSSKLCSSKLCKDLDERVHAFPTASSV